MFVPKDKSSDSKVKFRQASNHSKRVLEAAKLAYANETPCPLLPRNLATVTFDGLLIMFSKKVNLLYLLYSMTARCYLLHLLKQNCLLKTFPRILILMIGESLYLFFPFRTNLKLHNISVTPKMVKTIIMNLDLSKVLGVDCIPVVVLKNCEPELSYCYCCIGI